MTATTAKTIKKDKKKVELNAYSIIVGIVLIIYSISFFVPLIWGFNVSLMSMEQFVYKKDVLGLPDLELWKIDFDTPGNIFGNYVIAYRFMHFNMSKQWVAGMFVQKLVVVKEEAGLFECLINTLLYAFGCSLTFLAVTITVGYLCAKYKYAWSDFTYAVVIFCMVMPMTNTQPAMIQLLRALNIFNTHFSMWLTGASFRSMYFLIFYGFFKDLPNTYNEAAEIDGASQFATMLRICIPLPAKMITTIILIQFVASWNNYTVPMIYMPTKPTLAYLIYYLIFVQTGSILTIVPRKVACLMCLAIPILVLFIFLKDKLMGNISIGGIKE